VFAGEKAGLAWALALVAGFTDAAGFLTLNHLFTAHMSGNSAHLGVFLGQYRPWAALPLASAVLLFVVGIGLAAAVAELASRRGIKSVTACLLIPQALMLVVFMGYGASITGANGKLPDHGPGFYVLAALAIFSIGFQVCALQRVAGNKTRTAFVSAMLAKFAQESVNWLFWLHDGEERPGGGYLEQVIEGGSRKESLLKMILFGGIWCWYLAGAVGGTWLHHQWHLWSMAIPIALLIAAAAINVYVKEGQNDDDSQ
jgi:uncharacterized membrane protein YoaK (UPF0700 family)